MADVARLRADVQGLIRRVERAVPLAIDDIGEELVERAKPDVPVDSGTLRESLTSERNGLHLSVGPQAGVTNPKGVPVEEYAEEVEYDQPYLRPTFDTAGPTIEKALRNRLSKL